MIHCYPRYSTLSNVIQCYIYNQSRNSDYWCFNFAADIVLSLINRYVGEFAFEVKSKMIYQEWMKIEDRSNKSMNISIILSKRLIEANSETLQYKSWSLRLDVSWTWLIVTDVKNCRICKDMVGFHSVYGQYVAKVDVPSIGLETLDNWRRSMWNTNC